MTNEQLFVFALVTAIYIPCVATIAALARELGWKRAILIMGFTIVLAVFVGGLVNQLLLAFRCGYGPSRSRALSQGILMLMVSRAAARIGRRPPTTKNIDDEYPGCFFLGFGA